LRPVIVLADGAAAGARAFVLKNRGRANTEAMNSAADRDAVGVEQRDVALTGKRPSYACDPYSLTLLEIRLQ
jgi:hypothetical protein